MGVYRSDDVKRQRASVTPALPVVVSMSPPGYPSARLLPSRAGFRFTPATSVYLRGGGGATLGRALLAAESAQLASAFQLLIALAEDLPLA